MGGVVVWVRSGSKPIAGSDGSRIALFLKKCVCRTLMVGTPS